MTKSIARSGILSALVIVIMALVAGTMTEHANGSNSDHGQDLLLSVDPTLGNIDPSSPRDLTAKAGDNIVLLKWQPPASAGDGEYYYIIQRSVDGSPWMNLTAVEAGAVSFSDRWVANGHETCYRMISVVDGTWSRPSNVAKAIPMGAPYPPSYLDPQVEGATVIITIHPPLYDGGSDVTGYILYRRSSIDTRFNEIARLNASENRFVDNSVAGNLSVGYYAVALNSVGDSDRSEITFVENIPSSEAEHESGADWIRTALKPVLGIAGISAIVLITYAIYKMFGMRRHVAAMPVYPPRSYAPARTG